MNARLLIARSQPDDVQDRPLRLWVESEWLENLSYGKTRAQDIAPGRHVVKAHNTLFGTTLECEAAPGEEVRSSCANGMTGGGKPMVRFMGGAYLRVRFEQLPSGAIGDVS